MDNTESIPFYLKPFITVAKKRPRYKEDALMDEESSLKRPFIEKK